MCDSGEFLPEGGSGVRVLHISVVVGDNGEW